MKHIILPNTKCCKTDDQQLETVIADAIANKYDVVLKPGPITWESEGHFHFESERPSTYSWHNSKGKEVVVFLISSATGSGYYTEEFETGLLDL